MIFIINFFLVCHCVIMSVFIFSFFFEPICNFYNIPIFVFFRLRRHRYRKMTRA